MNTATRPLARPKLTLKKPASAEPSSGASPDGLGGCAPSADVQAPAGLAKSSSSNASQRKTARIWREVWPRIAKAFPNVFGSQNARRPLKIGIAKDLQVASATFGDEPLGAADIKSFLRMWTQCPAYWRCLVADAVRYDLDGIACGVVTPDEDAKARAAETACRKKRELRTSVLSNRSKSHKTGSPDSNPCPEPVRSAGC